MKKVIGAFLCSAWLVLGGATGESGQAQAQEKKLTDITFSLDFITLGRHAPFYVAIDKGFYKEEGLDVEILEGSGSTTVAQLAANQTNPVAYVDAATMMRGVGAGMPIRAVGVTLQPVEKTLTDEEITAVCQKIVESVAKQTGGVLRS